MRKIEAVELMAKIVNHNFFEKPTLVVAKSLLGKYLCRCYRDKIIKSIITEVEAYDGFKDKASHAARGLTKRNKIMFGPAGRWYVYFTYGMHWMLNIVTGKKGYPAAVLIRGIKGINGPARVTKFLKIGKRFNGKPANGQTGLWFEDNPSFRNSKLSAQGGSAFGGKIKSSPRIGVNYAGPVWSKKPYRFKIEA